MDERSPTRAHQAQSVAAISAGVARGGLAGALVAFTAPGGWPSSLARETPSRPDGGEAAAHQRQQLRHGVGARRHQQPHQGVFQPRHALGEVGFPAQFAVAGLRLDGLLLELLH